VSDVLDGAEVLVDFTTPATAVENARAAVGAGVHAVIGTTGFDLEAMRAAAESGSANVFVAPNFAIGAVLMMRFAVEAARHMQAAEIIEYHHAAKLDAPSGTAKRTADLMRPALPGDVPIHSVRLPGVVADQDVILGDVAQTLTLRHVTTDRTSFMPGVLLAVRRVAALPDRLTVGLESLLE
jgi:4-hydroxy-tetrahydrodipicolinate reductase